MILLWMLAEVFRKTSCPIEIFCGTPPAEQSPIERLWHKLHETVVV